MRRRYRVQRFLDRLDQIRDLLGPATAFSTDVIVGFPGETDDEFQQTLDTCRRARFMKVHVFPFSRRDGTPAASMPDQISPEEIRRRVSVLSDLERQLALEYYRERVQDSAAALSQNTDDHPADLQVLAERLVEGRTDRIRGTDRWYMPVECAGTAADLGQFVRCRAASASLHSVSAVRLQADRNHQALPSTASLHSLPFTDLSPETAELEPAQMLCDSAFNAPLVSLGFPDSSNPASAGAPRAI